MADPPQLGVALTSRSARPSPAPRPGRSVSFRSGGCGPDRRHPILAGGVEHHLEFTLSENPWAPTAVIEEINARTGAGLTLTGISGQAGGVSSAAFVRWPDGRDGALTRTRSPLARMRRTAAVLDMVRARGLPVPRHDLLLAQRSPTQFAVDTSIVVPQLLGHHHAAQKVRVESAVVLITGFAAWRHRRAGADLLLPIGLIGSMLSATFLHLDDLLLLIPAAWLTLRVRADAVTIVPLVVLFTLAMQIGYGSSPPWSALFVAAEGGWLLILGGLRRPDERGGAPGRSPGRPDPDLATSSTG